MSRAFDFCQLSRQIDEQQATTTSSSPAGAPLLVYVRARGKPRLIERAFQSDVFDLPTRLAREAFLILALADVGAVGCRPLASCCWLAADVVANGWKLAGWNEREISPSELSWPAPPR